MSLMKPLERVYPLIKSFAELTDTGISARKVKQMYASGVLIPLAQNQYIYAQDWNALNPAEQHAARITAFSRRLKSAVFSHQSAACAYGIPVLHYPREVHMRSGGGIQHPDIRVHEDRYTKEAPHAHVLSKVFAVNRLETVVGCARTLPLDDAVVIADGALSHQQEGARLDYSEVQDALLSSPRKGAAKAREVARLMSDKSDSPGETLTRLRLYEYGLSPTEQYPITTEMGQFLGDFAFEAQRVIVEFDGRVKQTSRVMNPDGWAIDREKERENALMRAGWRLIRLRWEHVNGGNPKVLEQSLRNFGLI